MAEGFDPYHKWLGIPPKDQPPNHYRLLGIELFESDPEVIDMAASRLMSHLQELASGPDLKYSQKLLNEIAAARRYLLKPEAKEAYDRQLKASQPKTPPKREPPAPKPPPAPPKEPAKPARPEPPPAKSFPEISVHDPPKVAKERKPQPRKKKPSSSSVDLADSGYLAELEKTAGESAENADPPKTIASIDLESSKRRASAVPSIDADPEANTTAVEEEPTWSNVHRMWLLVGGGAVAILLVVLVFGLFTSDDETGQSSRKSAATRRKESTDSSTLSRPRLVFNWAPNERGNARLMINGEAKDVTAEGALEFELDEGSYRFRIEREGFEPIDGSGSLVAGITREYSPTWKRVSPPPEAKTFKPQTPPVKPAEPAKPTASKPPAPPAKNAAKAKSEAQQKKQVSKPPPKVNFFADWPKALHLPPSRSANGDDSLSEMQLATMHGSQGRSLQVSLLGGNTVLGDVGRFVLSHSNDNQHEKYVVKHVGKAAGEIPVAAFTLRKDDSHSGHSLTFAWSKGVRVPRVDRLRNCLLKVAIGGKERTSPLRRTVKSDPVPLASPGGGILSQRPVDAMPERSLLRLQITALTGPKPYQHTYEDVAIAADGNQVILLQEGENPIHSRVQLKLKADRIEIESRILYHNAATNDQEVFSPRVGKRQLETFRQRKQQLDLQRAALGDPGRDEAKRAQINQLAAASNRVGAQVRYLEGLIRLCEQQHSQVLAHFRLTATIDGHQVCLARSD